MLTLLLRSSHHITAQASPGSYSLAWTAHHTQKTNQAMSCTHKQAKWFSATTVVLPLGHTTAGQQPTGTSSSIPTFIDTLPHMAIK
ncbi:hypothetical protein E2C01_019725 [Portunus trituberculatus]|uniref:Uncharacterized protein n=1 Tax=Portunus trituberculatus TaxID=210409 RepID=A0A5B7E066_PORTR|nr:hypothetical protein [Portunus trituberculatus]